MRTTGLTYDDLLEMFPEETKLRIELIGGELLMAASPALRHQRVVMRLTRALDRFAKDRGGEVFGTILDIRLTDRDVVQPDIVYFRKLLPTGHPVDVVPDLVVEVSSPSTRGVDRGRKRDLYERHGVGEYWFVDLERDRIEVHRREGDHLARPIALERGDRLTTPLLPGLSIEVGPVLGEPA